MLAGGGYADMSEVRAANARAGFHFFDPDTLRFFGSRIGGTLYGGRYFVTSERDPHGVAWNGERRYTVRAVESDGRVHTVGAFGAYGSRATAVRAAQALAEGSPEVAA